MYVQVVTCRYPQLFFILIYRVRGPRIRMVIDWADSQYLYISRFVSALFLIGTFSKGTDILDLHV